MSKIRFRISPSIIKKANSKLMTNKPEQVAHSSGLVARYVIKGEYIERNISSEDIKSAYAKSLAEYAEKL